MPKLTTLFDFNDRTSRKLKILTGNFKNLQKTTNKPITLTARDRASRTIRTIDRNVHRIASKSYKVTVRTVDLASSTIGKVRGALTSIPAMVTVGLSVVGAKSFLDATVGAAAQMELAQVQVTSLFGKNQKAANKFFNFLNKAGADSMFSQEDFFGSGRAFVPLTKNLKELKYAVSITERLAASNPLEGMEGASFSIREALSGDLVSLAERFNLPKTMLKSVKAAPSLQKKLEALDKVLGKMGYSQQYLDRVNETGYVRWQKLIDTTKLKLTDMGRKGLQEAKPLINDLTKMVEGKGFRAFGDTVSEGIVWGIKKVRNGVSDLNDYFSNPEFKKLDFEGKIKFVLGDIKAWWNSTGKPALDGWWTSSGQPWAEDIGLSMGKAIFSGIIKGTKEGIKSIGGMWGDAFKNPSVSSFSGAGIASALAVGAGGMLLSPIFKGVKGIGKGGKSIWNFGKKTKERFSSKTKKSIPKTPTTISYSDQSKKIAMGQQKTVKSQSKLTKALGKFKLPSWGKSISKKIPFLGTALSGAEIITAKGVKGKSKAAGGLAGGSAGTAIGGAIGSVIPGAGTVVGGLAGGLLGSWLGDKVGGWVGNKATSNNQSSNNQSSNTSTSSVPNTNLQLDTSSLAALNTNIASAAKNMQILTMYSGMASGYLASLMPIQGEASRVVFNLGALTMYTGMASGALASLIPIQNNANLIVFNLSGLTMYAGMASGALASLMPVQASAGLVVSNLNILTSYAGQASGWIATLYPVAGSSALVVSNLNILASYAGMASGWIASISYIPSSAVLVQTALSNLASRINTVQAPNISVGGGVGGRLKGFAKGTKGPLNKSQWAWVGEKGPELMRLNKGTEVFNNRESMSMANRTLPKEQVAAATTSSNSTRGQSSGIRDLIVQITGENHYSNDMDAENVGKTAFSYIKRKLEEEYFAGSGMAIYD